MNPRLAIVLLVVLFVGPIAVSWLLINSGVNWSERGLSNHGILLNPPIDLRTSKPTGPLFEALELGPSEWAVLNVSAGACDEACLERHDRLQVIWSVIGSARDRLVASSVTTAEGDYGDRNLIVAPESVKHIQARLAAAEPSADLPQIIVVDWRRQLMLRFAADAPSGDIQKDLKKLLRASKIR